MKKIYRFADIAVRPQAVAADNIFFLAGRCEYDNRQKPRPCTGSDLFQNVVPAEARQVQIQQDKLWHCGGVAPGIFPGPEKIVERFDTIPDNDNLVFQLVSFQRAQSQYLIIRVIFD